MKRLSSFIAVVALTLTLSGSSFGGTITGSRTGTITGSKSGTITGSKSGTITGSKSGTITGSRSFGTEQDLETLPANLVAKLALLMMSLSW